MKGHILCKRTIVYHISGYFRAPKFSRFLCLSQKLILRHFVKIILILGKTQKFSTSKKTQYTVFKHVKDKVHKSIIGAVS